MEVMPPHSKRVGCKNIKGVLDDEGMGEIFNGK